MRGRGPWWVAAVLAGCTASTSMVARDRRVLREGPGYVALETLDDGLGLEVRWTTEAGRLVGRLTRPSSCRAADLRFYRDERVELSPPPERYRGTFGTLGLGLAVAAFGSVGSDRDRSIVPVLGLGIMLGSALVALHEQRQPEEPVKRTVLESTPGVEVVRLHPGEVACGQVSLDALVLSAERQVLGDHRVEPTALAPRGERVELAPPAPGTRLRVVVVSVPDDLLPLVRPGAVLYEGTAE